MLVATASAYLALLVPVVTAIVGALGLAFKDWRLSRDSRNRRERALSAASAEVGFASDWLRAHQLLGDDATAEAARKVREWLGDAEAKVAATQHLSEHKRTPITFRRLFLMRPMHGRSARILRRLFWLSIAWLLVVPTLGTLAELTEKHSANNPNEVGTSLALLAVSAAAVLILRTTASVADRNNSAVAGSPVATGTDDRDASPVATGDPSGSGMS